MACPSSSSCTSGIVRGMYLFEDRAVVRDELVTKTGVARVWALSDTIYVSCITGYVADEHAEFFARFGDDRLRRTHGKLSLFHNWMGMTGYDSRCRQRMTKWSLDRLARFDEVHIAQRSRLVAMGIQVANIALGGKIRMHGSVGLLEVELRRVLMDSDEKG